MVITWDTGVLLLKELWIAIAPSLRIQEMQTQVKVGSDTIFKLERDNKDKDKLLEAGRKDLATCRLSQQKVPYRYLPYRTVVVEIWKLKEWFVSVQKFVENCRKLK